MDHVADVLAQNDNLELPGESTPAGRSTCKDPCCLKPRVGQRDPGFGPTRCIAGRPAGCVIHSSVWRSLAGLRHDALLTAILGVCFSWRITLLHDAHIQVTQQACSAKEAGWPIIASFRHFRLFCVGPLGAWCSAQRAPRATVVQGPQRIAVRSPL